MTKFMIKSKCGTFIERGYMSNNGYDENDIIFTQQKLINLAQITWSIQKYSNKLIVENDLTDKSRPLKSNLSKLESFLNDFGVQIIDYTNQKYNDGMNVDIIDTVKTDISEPSIKETIEPSITINGTLVKKARVIKEINRSDNE